MKGHVLFVCLFFAHWREMEPAGDKTTFFLFFSPSFSSQVPMHRFRVPTHPPLGQVKGGQHDLQLWGESGVAGLGERHGGMAAGIPALDITPYCSSHFSGEEQAPPRGKTITPSCGKTAHLSLRRPPSPVLWNPTCHTLQNPACLTLHSFLFFNFFSF